ncbi:MAG: hypothetical protein OEZ01_04210, partial [Candidatus Heimdallarchaeota archaeon]|nr:hypothetical protein [Candidatus Heimdallarchaeota archaeon]
MSDTEYENASQRSSFVGQVFDRGEKIVKKRILDTLPKEWSDLHINGYLHLHDLEAYEITYNCLTFDIVKSFPFNKFEGISSSRKIMKVFDFYKDIITKIGNEQSGGMSFANFDTDTAFILNKLNVDLSDYNRNILRDQINGFITWCNDGHERMGKVSYYVSLNIGLGLDVYSQTICEYVLDEFYNSPVTNIKPNIIFKLKGGINKNQNDVNYYLYEKAVNCTIKKMIPTYLLADCASNKLYDANKLAIMGCRTRVVDNVFGEPTAIGRGNIVYLSINLPKIALEIDREFKDRTIQFKLEEYYKLWKKIAISASEILLHRFTNLTKLSKSNFPNNVNNNLWITSFKEATSLDDVFKHGTLSIGFIGLSEMIEVLTGNKYYESEENYQIAKDFVTFMRKFTDELRLQHNKNFSLLATSGEFISGRFPSIDSKEYSHPVTKKKFYTNSFHVNVDSNLSAFEKVKFEGYFHRLTNGGCITYIELNSAPIGNSEAIIEVIRAAETAGVHYLGFNYPLDICNKCGEKGVFDFCEYCGSNDILRIRRVSGYLEILDYFT